MGLFQRKRMVRVHLKGDAPSISGLLVGRYGGHYVVDVARLHEAVDQTIELQGKVEIPVGNVLFLQNLVAVSQ